VLRKEQQEQARRAFSARARKRHQRNVKSSVALEAKALGGGGVEFPEALVAVKLALRTMAKFSEDYIAAIEHEFRQLRGSTKCCKAGSGPAPEESAEAASGLTELLACLGAGSYSRFPLSASGSSEIQSPQTTCGYGTNRRG
jgi:hypothetical protein